MKLVATTRLSTKGQVVIPENVRRALGLEVGARFIVLADRDLVLLKRIVAPKARDTRKLIGRIRARSR